MSTLFSRASVLPLLALVACVGTPPPPPQLTVTSPERAMVQTDAQQITVQGIALPGADGDAVAAVSVNGTPAQLAADGSFTAVVDVPTGAMLLETTATSTNGATITDARAVQLGQLQPVGSSVARAISASLSTDAFARLSDAASALVETVDLTAMLAPMQPMAKLGDDIANLQLSITKLAVADAKFRLTPTDAGLQISVEIDGLDFGADAAYAGALVPDGTTQVTVTADSVTVSGVLQVTPNGTAGFTTKLASPTVQLGNLQLHADGLTGQLLTLLDNNLQSTVQSIVASSAEKAIEPLMNDALGALAGPQQLDVLGQKLDLQASPSAIQFSNAGALVTLDLSAKLEGSEASPGFIVMHDGTPALDPSNGVQLAISDNFLNEMLAEVHALGLLDLHIAGDFGVFDAADIKLTLPPMITANTKDGSMRLILGDMVATFTNHGQPVLSAALNASVDLQIERGTSAQQIALQFGKVDLFVNLIDSADATAPSVDGVDLSTAATQGIAVQLDHLSKFLLTVPVPTVAGMQLDSLSLHGDSGYVVVAGQIH